MKVFGSHNMKPLLALLNWTGAKKETEEEEKEKGEEREEREEVEEEVTSFLQLLLGSTRQGVVFPDPELGCGDRSDSVNPLAREVVQQLQRPWERPALAPVLVSLVTACPGTLPALLLPMQGEVGQPRDSPAWHQVADLLQALLSCPPPAAPPQPHHALLHAIVTKLLLPHKLLSLLSSGVRESEVAAVRSRCLSLLSLMVAMQPVHSG